MCASERGREVSGEFKEAAEFVVICRLEKVIESWEHFLAVEGEVGVKSSF